MLHNRWLHGNGIMCKYRRKTTNVGPNLLHEKIKKSSECCFSKINGFAIKSGYIYFYKPQTLNLPVDKIFVNLLQTFVVLYWDFHTDTVFKYIHLYIHMYGMACSLVHKQCMLGN